MRIYVIQELGFEYNDESYDRGAGDRPVKAFREQANAQAECDRLNRERVKQERDGGVLDYDGRPFKEYYTVECVDVADDDFVDG